jgi:K+-transporting ATPase ATPase B chain
MSAIGIAGMDRLLRKNVIAMSGRAVEAAGDVDTLLLDKTGTITLGNRQATAFIPADGVSADDLLRRLLTAVPLPERTLRNVVIGDGMFTLSMKGTTVWPPSSRCIASIRSTRLPGCTMWATAFSSSMSTVMARIPSASVPEKSATSGFRSVLSRGPRCSSFIAVTFAFRPSHSEPFSRDAP